MSRDMAILKQKSIRLLFVCSDHFAHLPAILLLVKGDVVYTGKVFENHGCFGDTCLSALVQNLVAGFAIVVDAFVGFQKSRIFFFIECILVGAVAVLEILGEKVLVQLDATDGAALQIGADDLC